MAKPVCNKCQREIKGDPTHLQYPSHICRKCYRLWKRGRP